MFGKSAKIRNFLINSEDLATLLTIEIKPLGFQIRTKSTKKSSFTIKITCFGFQREKKFRNDLQVEESWMTNLEKFLRKTGDEKYFVGRWKINLKKIRRW